jgi:anti-sigma factor RsiW
MDCKEFREVLDLYIDAELAPERMTAAQAHLSECAACERAEKELLRLRRALKLAVSQHQPPDELVLRVRRLSQPFWRRLLPAQDSEKVDERRAQNKHPSWRKSVTLPLPVFALLLLAVVVLGVWSISLRASRERPQEAASSHLQPAPGRATEHVEDLSRFDRGERATIYKVRR